MNDQEKSLHEIGNDFQYNDFDDIGSITSDYFDQRKDFHKLDKVIKASETKEAKKVNGLADALKKIREEFRALVREICEFKKLKPIFENFLNRMIQDKDGDRILEDTLPKLETYLRRFKKKLFNMFFQFRKLLPRDYELEDLLDDNLYPRIESNLRTWLRRNTAHAVLDEEAQVQLISQFMGLIRQIIQRIMDELRETYPALFDPESSQRLENEIDKRDEIQKEASDLKQRLLTEIPGLDEILDYVKEHRKRLSLAVLNQLLKSLMKVVSGVLRKNLPEDTDYPSGKKAGDLSSLEREFEKMFRKKLGILEESSHSPAHVSPSKKTHKCGATLMSQSGTCKRPTTNEHYCFQHESRVPSGKALQFAGKWRMTGKQENVLRSGWKADLVLKKNGRLTWKQTAGANIWAKRSGRWMFLEGVFSMEYRAPKVGRVEWISRKMRVGSKSMGGTYSTPQVISKGKGWGGDWHARRTE